MPRNGMMDRDRPAGFLRRAFALGLDCLLIQGAFAALAVVAFAAVREGARASGIPDPSEGSFDRLLICLVVLWLLLPVLYFTLFISFGGQTPAKRIARIQVIPIRRPDRALRPKPLPCRLPVVDNAIVPVPVPGVLSACGAPDFASHDAAITDGATDLPAPSDLAPVDLAPAPAFRCNLLKINKNSLPRGMDTIPVRRRMQLACHERWWQEVMGFCRRQRRSRYQL